MEESGKNKKSGNAFNWLLNRLNGRVKSPVKVELWDGTSYQLGEKGPSTTKVLVNNKNGLAAWESFDERHIC